MSIVLLLPLLLTAAGGDASNDGRCGAAEVFHCTFDRAWDADYDGWPTGWTRRTDPAFPNTSKSNCIRSRRSRRRAPCGSCSTAGPRRPTARSSRSTPCSATSSRPTSRPKASGTTVLVCR